MATPKLLSRFVRDALSAGQSRDQIAQTLQDAGWSTSEIRQALNAWADTNSVVPVPRPQVIVSARDFFVYMLTFGLLLFTAIFLVNLLHDLIDVWAEDLKRQRNRGIRWSIAVLIVTGPLYLWLTIRDGRAVQADPARYRSVIRKWLTYLALLVSAATLIGALISTIYAFLQGDFTGQFTAKVAVVAMVAGGVFAFYLRDIRTGDAL